MYKFLKLAVLTLLSLITIDANQDKACPVVLGHRGAAGIYPEHTEIGKSIFWMKISPIDGNHKKIDQTCVFFQT